MNYDLLKEVLSQFESFEKNSDKSAKNSLEDFTSYLLQQDTREKAKENKPRSNQKSQIEIEVGISRLIVFLHRYAKLYLKSSLASYPELINEDFTYLYTLVRYGNMSKMRLIEKNIHEKSSGLEVIKRLLKHKLIEEFTDPNDKRSKIVHLTDKGISSFNNSKEITGNVARLVAGTLSLTEKNKLYDLLKKLDKFHNELYLAKEVINFNGIHT